MSNSLRPRRSSTSAVQRPAESADTRYGCSIAAAAIVTVPSGSTSRAGVYEVASSPTSTTAVTGEVTASVGGLANRTSWTPMIHGEHGDQDREQRRDDDAGENVRPWRGASSGRGTVEHGLVRDERVAALAAPLADDVLGVEAEVQRVVAQEALRVHGARQLGVLAGSSAWR